MRKLFLAIGVILALLVATSIQSFAEDDIIYGCVGKAGKLRIVDDPSECRKSETPIYWNVVGPQGPEGPQGPQGECDTAIIVDIQNQIDALQNQIDFLLSMVWRFTDLSDGTVRDNSTGLIWLKDANCFGQMNWDDAMYEAELLEHDHCGLTDGSVAGDWRLPTYEEWLLLFDTNYTNPALCNVAGTGQWSEGDAFNNVQMANYWDSTVHSPGNARAANMYWGYVTAFPMSTTLWVWPVRDAD